MGEALERAELAVVDVAVLFADPKGVYANLPGVDLWDEARDARLYAGPWPVVAHPPCNRWVSYGPRERRGNDGGCFEAALRAVRTYGGVLEHPARSQAWKCFGLPTPHRGGWRRTFLEDAWVIEMDQHAYGFATRKVTWLYVVGVPFDVLSAPDAGRGCDRLWSSERSKTTPAMRDVLLTMARSTPVAVPVPDTRPDNQDLGGKQSLPSGGES